MASHTPRNTVGLLCKNRFNSVGNARGFTHATRYCLVVVYESLWRSRGIDRRCRTPVTAEPVACVHRPRKQLLYSCAHCCSSFKQQRRACSMRTSASEQRLVERSIVLLPSAQLIVGPQTRRCNRARHRARSANGLTEAHKAEGSTRPAV